MSRESSVTTLLQFMSFPLNSEDMVFAMFESLPKAVTGGSGLSKWCYIPGTRTDKVLLVAHADTVWHSKELIQQELLVKNQVVTGKNILYGIGADDRAGCAILYLLRDSGHSLLIVNGEERGCIGSKEAVDTVPVSDHQFVLQFDRRGSTDYKCYDVGSKKFRRYVEKLTGYIEPNRFSTTDIRVLCKDICGVNLSVGYLNEHSSIESLNINHWYSTYLIAKEWLGGYCTKFVRPKVVYKLTPYYEYNDEQCLHGRCYICNKPMEVEASWLCNSCCDKYKDQNYF